jgi:cytochrome b subunit of formate dehydrogenase
MRSTGEEGKGIAMNREVRGKANRIRRFSTYRILEHWGIILTTMILFATGLCQRFWHLETSQWFILKLGGIDNVRLIHRYAGLFFSLELLSNVIVGMMGVIRGKWQPTMFITKKDYEDAVHNIRYYFGFENHPAKCDRYDYMEKFEYWTILVGGVLMIATGFILWLPILVTRFLPGEIIPAAKALHSNEAMLIFSRGIYQGRGCSGNIRWSLRGSREWPRRNRSGMVPRRNETGRSRHPPNNSLRVPY